MSPRWLNLSFSASHVAVVAAVGCSGRPIGMDQIAIDAVASGHRAIEAYDTDGDGIIAGEEFDQVASLKSASIRLDQDQDGRVTAEEIAGLIRAANSDATATTSVKCNVSLDGKPLAGATVTFEPEEFLGAGIPLASGVTNENGQADITIAQLQREDPTDEGVHIGLYRVKISKVSAGNETIPAKYNIESILGIEVASRAAWKPGAAQFDLTTN